MSGLRARGSTSDDDEQVAQSPLSIAKGWLATAAAPVAAYRQRQEREAALAEVLGRMKAGAQMQLLPESGSKWGSSAVAVRVALSQDSDMLTWQSVGGASPQSGVLALSAVREVKPVLESKLFNLSGTIKPKKGQWELVSDDQVVRFEAADDEVKDDWLKSIEELARRQGEAKVGRKLAYTAKRKLGLDERKRDAEKRKAEIMKSCGMGGMKHTAAAMINRA